MKEKRLDKRLTLYIHPEKKDALQNAANTKTNGSISAFVWWLFLFWKRWRRINDA